MTSVFFPPFSPVYAQTTLSVKNTIHEKKRQINEHIKASSLELLGWDKK